MRDSTDYSPSWLLWHFSIKCEFPLYIVATMISCNGYGYNLSIIVCGRNWWNTLFFQDFYYKVPHVSHFINFASIHKILSFSGDSSTQMSGKFFSLFSTQHISHLVRQVLSRMYIQMVDRLFISWSFKKLSLLRHLLLLLQPIHFLIPLIFRIIEVALTCLLLSITNAHSYFGLHILFKEMSGIGHLSISWTFWSF